VKARRELVGVWEGQVTTGCKWWEMMCCYGWEELHCSGWFERFGVGSCDLCYCHGQRLACCTWQG